MGSSAGHRRHARLERGEDAIADRDEAADFLRQLLHLQVERGGAILDDFGHAPVLVAGMLDVGTHTLTLRFAVAKIGGSLVSAAGGTVRYDKASDGQMVIAGQYGNLVFSDFTKTLYPGGIIFISGVFDPGTATGHTVEGSTVEYASSVRLIREWPTVSATIFGWTPDASSNSRRRVAGRDRIFDNFAASSTSLNTLRTLRSSNGVPIVEANTASGIG